ncbi:MAG: serine hydrolase domain-containing protein [Ilumatobacteraceae bacterium]
MDAEGLEAELTALAEAQSFSGVVRIDGPGGPWFARAYGLASPTWNVPCTLHTRFDTASITKLFTAVATLQQIEAGAFDLGTSVVEYLGLTGTRIAPAVNPYHLLTHTSGIGDDADEEAGELYEDLFVDKPSYSITETEHFLPQFVHKPPNFAPGEGCRYCNVGYVLLGLMIEKATGASYREYVTEHVFAPAGMGRAGFFRKDVVEPDVAEGVDPIVDADGHRTGWRRNLYAYPPIGSPDGGAHVTADDLMRFHAALRAGRLLGPDSTTAILTPQVHYRDRPPGEHLTGYGFEFETGADGTVRSMWKEGINVGASGMLRYYPRRELTVVVLSNMQDGAWEPLRIIDRLVEI